MFTLLQGQMLYLKPFFLFEDCEHSLVQLARPVRLRRTPFRSRQSVRASIIYKGPPLFVAQQSVDPSKNATDQVTSTSTTQGSETAESGSTVNGVLEPHTEEDKGQGN